MKSRLILPVLWSAAFSVSVHAQIFKCTTEDSVSYQEKPCAAGPAAVVEIPRAARNPDAGAAAASVLKEESGALPQARDTISVGMTDLQVLNLRGWGRPQKIARNKTQRVWHEEWTYGSPSEGLRLLRFANGKLTNVDTALPESSSVEQVVNLQ